MVWFHVRGERLVSNSVLLRQGGGVMTLVDAALSPSPAGADEVFGGD